jgi:hypothetical protein
MEWIRVSTDPFNADGLISNDATGQTWLMEHVFVPGPTPKHPQGRQEDVGELVLEQIALKVAKDDDYCRGKTLFILCNEAGPWVPDDVVKKLPSPGTFNAIWAGNRTGKTTTGEFVYHLVRLDWVQRYAPRWRLTIAPDFGSWTVVKEQ